MKIKRLAAFIILLVFMFTFTAFADGSIAADSDISDDNWIGGESYAVSAGAMKEVDARSAILVEASTGTVLFEQNADEPLPPASVTKIMTMLLVMEALEEGKISLDTVCVCSANAAGMGGSQVYLKEGEQMTVHDLLKAIAVASGNDASVMIAEHLAGSEEAFVSMMNEKAKELGMENTNFANACGLENPSHRTTARDISIMSRELMSYELIYDYTTIWIDSLRNGEFQLANTNRLIRFYPGATGLKTGSTEAAKNCISATARKNDMDLIAVILGAETSSIRFEEAKKLLDYGFANYSVINIKTDEINIPQIKVNKGVLPFTFSTVNGETRLVVEKGKEGSVTYELNLTDSLTAPVEKGQKVGEIKFSLDGEEIISFPIVTTAEVKKANYWFYLKQLWMALVG